jgi:ABC-type amino acid transport system permease subunit
MTAHDLLSVATIVVHVIGITVALLEMMGYRIHVRTGDRSAPRFQKRPVSRLRRFVLVLLTVILVSSLTWLLTASTVWNVVYQYFPELLGGVARTIGVSLLAIFFGTLMGALCAYVITSEATGWWATPIIAVLESAIYLLLALPVIIVIFIIYYSNRLDKLWIVATMALAVNLSPFVAKILAGSIRSISRDQIDAARAFGYSDWQVTRYFKIKYVIAISAQSLLVEYYTTIKLSSLTAYIGFREVLHVSQDIIKDTQDPVTAYIILAFCYIAIVTPLALVADHLERISRAKI